MLIILCILSYLLLTFILGVVMNLEMIRDELYSDKEVAAAIIEVMIYFPLLLLLTLTMAGYSGGAYLYEFDYVGRIGKIIRRSVKFVESYL